MPVPAVVSVDDDQVLAGNPWSYARTFPATDDQGDPLTYGTFTVTSMQIDGLTVSQGVDGDGNTVVTWGATADQVAACPDQWFHWYLAEDQVFADIFLTGSVQIVARR